MIKFMLDKGVDVHINNDMALQKACEQKSFEIVEILLEHGADPNAEYAICLLIAVEHEDLHMVNLLVQFGANPALRKDIILNAVKTGDVNLVKFLVEHGSRLDVTTNQVKAKTPLDLAIIHGHKDVAKYLESVINQRK